MAILWPSMKRAEGFSLSMIIIIRCKPGPDRAKGTIGDFVHRTTVARITISKVDRNIRCTPHLHANVDVGQCCLKMHLVL